MSSNVDWPTPKALTRRAENPFPLDALPYPFKEFAIAVGAYASADPAAPAIASLAGIAAVIQHAVKIQIRPGYRESAALQVIPAMDTGTRKSLIVEAIQGPIKEWQEANRLAVNAARPLWEARHERLKRAMGKVPDDKADEFEAALHALQAHEAIEPIHRCWLPGTDLTFEGLMDANASNYGSTFVLDSEGSKYISMLMGRWSGGHQQADGILRGYTGEPYSRTRAGGKTRYIPRVQISTVIFMQPHLLERLTKEIRNVGFHARQLWIVPKARKGYLVSRTPPIPDPLQKWWNDLIRGLLQRFDPEAREDQEADIDLDNIPDLQRRDVGIKLVTLSEKADLLHERVCNQFQEKIRPGCKWECIDDWVNKAGGHMARIALTLHILEHPADFLETELSQETMQAAARITLWLADHAYHAIMRVSDPEQTSKDMEVARDWLRARSDSTPPGETFRFRASDLRAARRKTWATVKDMSGVLQQLVEGGWLRCLDEEQGWYELNPRCFREELASAS